MVLRVGQFAGAGSDGVLVGEDSVFALGVGYGRWVWEGLAVWVDDAGACIDGWHDGHVVLVFVEVDWGGGDGFVEGVEEGGVVRAKGELGDHVGKIEGWFISLVSYLK